MTATTSPPAAREHGLARPARATPWPRALLVLAAVLIGLHIADDRFLQPQPGTSASDHLGSGLVPLALTLAAAMGVASNRLRAGWRASLTLLLGYFGVVAGVEAVHAMSAGVLSGDDYSGMLSVLGGAILLGAGVVILWRARRADGTRLRRCARRALAGAGALAAVALVLFPVALAYVVTHTARVGVAAPHLGAPHEDVAFTTSDGLRLQGWFVPPRNGATVIAFPGRTGPQKHARMLIRHGYGILLFDRRGEGASEGDPNAFGWEGDRDLHAALAFLRGRADVDPRRIGGLGLSVGGEMLIHAAAHSHALRAIVSEGASGQSLRDGLANRGALDAIVSDGPITLTTAVFTDGPPPRSLRSEMANIAPTAVFLVYGENGQGGSERVPNRRFFDAARDPKAIWEVPKGQHIAGITSQPAEYERRVVGFFDRTLRNAGGTP